MVSSETNPAAPRGPRRFLDRDRAIAEIARARRVLHLGCVGNTDLAPAERVARARQSLHWMLSEIADTTGVDYSAEVVETYRADGLFDNILVGDVQRLEALDLAGPFDVVVAADIIEHLSNPGAMLDGIRRLCRADSDVVITTPHAFGLPNYLRFLAGRFRDGAEHVMTFNADNIANLLARHGFRIIRLDSCHQANARRHGLAFGVARALLSAAPRLGGTLFVVARPEKPSAD